MVVWNDIREGYFMMREKEKIIIFGAGYFGEIAAMTMGYEKEILFFVDNDEKKWEKTKLGFSIKPVSEAMLFGKEKVRVVIAMADYRAAVLQLEAMGVHNYVYFEDVYGDDFSCKSRDIMDREIPDTEDQIYRKYVKNAWMNHVTQHYDGERKDYIPSNGKCLDVGCGCGKQLFHWLCRGYDAYEIDCCKWKMEFCLQKIKDFSFPETWKDHFIFGKGEELPFKDNEFDAVASWQVLEHVDDWKTCIQEMLRVTKPGGVLFINAPDYRNSYEEHYRVDFGKPLVSNRNEFKEFLQENDKEMETFYELNFITTQDVLNELKRYEKEKKQTLEIINYEERDPGSAVIRENGKLCFRHRIDLAVRLL